MPQKKKNKKVSVAMIDGHPWAIQEEYFKVIEEIFDHENALSFFRPDQESASYLSVDDSGIATINIHGPIGLRLGFVGWLMDGVDSAQLIQDLQNADADYSIKGIMLHIDSPGGMVAGTQDAANAIRAFSKPIVAFSDQTIASGAYWLASAADKIFATPTSLIGSIGVVATHRDYSKQDEEYGVKTTYITAGKYKRIANDAEPLSEEGREYIQELIDGSYEIFTGEVARFRGMDIKAVKNTEARMYLAANAKEVGLIDQIADVKQAYNALRREAKLMDLNELKTDFPDVYKAVLDEGKGLVVFAEGDIKPEWADKLKSEGAEMERVRISDIQESAFEGQDELVGTLVKDGVSVDEARKQLIADEKAKKSAALGGLSGDDPGGDLGGNLNGDDDLSGDIQKGETADAALDRHARALMATDEKLTYKAATDAVLEAKPKLKAAYENLGR